jgi:hypothetical protein
VNLEDEMAILKSTLSRLAARQGSALRKAGWPTAPLVLKPKAALFTKSFFLPPHPTYINDICHISSDTSAKLDTLSPTLPTSTTCAASNSDLAKHSSTAARKLARASRTHRTRFTRLLFNAAIHTSSREPSWTQRYTNSPFPFVFRDVICISPFGSGSNGSEVK